MRDVPQTDPYVSLQIGPPKAQKTSTKNNAGGHDVIFDETISFLDKQLFDNILLIRVMDSDTLSDDTLGKNDYDVNQLNLKPESEENDVKVDLMSKNGKKKAGVVWLSFSRMSAPAGSFSGTLHVTVHKIDEFDDSAGFMDKVCNISCSLRCSLQASC